MKKNRGKFRGELIFKKKLKRRLKLNSINIYNTHEPYIVRGPIIKAPINFSYITHPLECNFFFNSLRTKEYRNVINNKTFYKICLKKVKSIDFAAICILKSIMEEAKLNGIFFKGSLPIDKECKKILVDYGFLNNLYDEKNNQLNIKSSGTHYSYEKKNGKLTAKDFEDFEQISVTAFNAITDEDGCLDELITILKEIGGNAAEWSNSINKQWLLSVHKKNNVITINVTDLGKGILESLFIGSKLKFIDFFIYPNPIDKLYNAFKRRYGSFSQEINRNRGLPFIKKCFDDGKIKNLIVSTNNVFYNFANYSSSKESTNKLSCFYGTFYQWEIDIDCIKNYEQ